MEKNLVVKANSVVRARYDLDLLEQKTILYAAALLDPDGEHFYRVTINVREFANKIDTTVKRYTEFKKLANRLMDKKVVLSDNKNLEIRWLASCEYMGDGNIELDFAPKLAPYLLQLKENFTRYQLKNILYLQHKYSIRIYEILKSWENMVQPVRLDLAELREMLALGGKYPEYKYLGRRVIDPAIGEINNHTDLAVSYTRVKEGRKIVALDITIKSQKDSKENEQAEQLYDIDEIRRKCGLDSERFTSAQIAKLYELGCSKAGDEVDPYAYILLNYAYMLEKGESVRKRYAYMVKALTEDYAKAYVQLRVGSILG